MPWESSWAGGEIGDPFSGGFRGICCPAPPTVVIFTKPYNIRPSINARSKLAKTKYLLSPARTPGRHHPLQGFPQAVKKKKVRVALRKNRQNRTRANDLTRRFRDDELAAEAQASSDRIRAKGDLSRHRTIIEESEAGDDQHASESNSDAAARRSVDPSVCVRGRVTRMHGLSSMVRSEDGRVHSCHVRRLLKSLEIEGRNVITVGDWVWLRPGTWAGADGLIEKVETRRGVITRGYRHRQHVIAANVDQVLVVSAFEEPGLKLNLIDRYLVSAEIGGVRPVIVLNKADLADLAAAQWVIGLYVQLGYETLVTSVKDGARPGPAAGTPRHRSHRGHRPERSGQELAAQRHPAGFELEGGKSQSGRQRVSIQPPRPS